jgi:TolA-binding protein
MKRFALAVILLGSIPHAAHSAPNPPKAVPVAPPKSSDPPPRAIPVAPAPGPKKSPTPANPAPPVVPPAPEAESPAPAPNSPPTPTTPENSNAKKSGFSPAQAPDLASSPASPAPGSARNPEDLQFDLAEGLTGQKQWEAAINEYQTFVQKFPNSPKLGSAYFRIAEAHEKLGNTNAARSFYGKQLAAPQPGPYAGKSAYVLARAEFEEGDYANSLAHYKRAAQLLDQPEAKLSSEYFAGRCLQFLGRNLEARNAFLPLANAPQEHPYREASQFQLALLLEEAVKPAEALAQFQPLSQNAQNPTVRAESATRTAILLLKLKDPEKAVPALENALKTPGTEQWHPLLKNNLFRAKATLGRDQEVIDSFPDLEPTLEPEQRTEMTRLVADAHYRLKQYRECLATLDKLLSLDPASTASGRARYDRLRCFYNLDAPELPAEIDSFLASTPQETDRDNALLMKAEFQRSKGDFANATSAYAQASKSTALKPQRKIEILLRWAECALRAEKTDEILASTSLFLSTAPEHSFAPTALYWRAESHRRKNAIPLAEKDYRQLVDRYPKAEERHNALLQLALLRGEQNDPAGMASLFERLIQDYPKSAEGPQAHHWIGWAAFEAKDYRKAIPHLEAARKAVPEKYQESDGLRLVYCSYYLNDAETCWSRVQESLLPAGKAKVPSEILRWMARQFSELKNPAKSEPAWALLCQGEEVQDADWLALAKDRLELGQYDNALPAILAYQKLVSAPSAQSLGFILQCRAQLGQGKPDDAQQSLEQALRLQPEGRLNAEARILAGDVQAAKGQWDAAAKLYASVAVVIDDEDLTPKALQKAQRAYQQAGKTKEAADTLNRLQSRYPEFVRKNLR